MFDDIGAGLGGCAGAVILVLLVLVLLILVGGDVLDRLQNAAAERDRAAANLEYARAERDRVRSEEWQNRFMVWTAYLDHSTNDAGLIVLAGLGGAATAAALVGGYSLGRRRP